ncbi:MAG: hypothetical protein J1E34_06645 [Oscillospiraceae bacterium]|nr:hypothetical protein [Oscillospiraceae bacterium]
MKKLISVLLSLAMIFAVMVPVSAKYDPASAYAEYDAEQIADSNSEYIASLSPDQIAGVILDYVDAYLAGIAEDVEIADGLTINTADMLDLNTLTAWAYDAISGDKLGGDFDNLDASALAGLSRENGDINYIYGMLEFMGTNADVFGKVFQWEKGNTFDCGKVGEYIENLPADDSVRVFYENYILGNDIQASFTNEVAKEMGYTIKDGETLDDVINNGVKEWIGGLLKDNGIVSEDAYNEIMDDAKFNLRTTDIYKLVKDLVAVVLDDNQNKIDTYLNLYLDNYLRIALNAAFGYTAEASENESSDKAAVSAEFKAIYDLALLNEMGETSVIFRANSGKYYKVAFTASDVTSVYDVTFENKSGIEISIPVISILTGDNDVLVKEYVPASTTDFDAAAYAPKIYTSQPISGVETAGKELPEEFKAIVESTTATPMKDYIKVIVTQNGEQTLEQKVSFEEIKAFAEQKAIEAGNQAVSAMGGKVNSVNVTLAYNGYATENAFVAQVLLESAVANVTIMNMTREQDITSIAQGMMPNPIASIVINGLAEKGSAEDASGLFNFLNLDYDVDYSEFLDFTGNYDKYNGVIGQANHILYGLVKMLLSEDGFASLKLVDGDNTNLTDNIQKIANNADSLIKTAKQYMDAEGLDAYLESMGVDDMFASTHGFNAKMLYELDFSSVETVYACVIKMGCDFFDDYDKDQVEDTIHELHEAIEDLTTLDQMAVAITDLVLDEVIVKVENFVNDYNEKNGTSFTYSYTNTHSDALHTENAKNDVMSKLVSFGIYTSEFVFDNIANDLINKAVDKLNEKLGTDVGDVSFKLNVTATGNWETDLAAFANRAVELTNGIIIAVGGLNANATAFDKLNTIINAFLPVSSFFSNCASDKFDCDLDMILNNYIFEDMLDGDFEGFLRLFEANNGTNKKNDCAYQVTTTQALIKASDHIVSSIFPGTVNVKDFLNVSDYTTVADRFTSSANDEVIAANNMRSINSVKADLVPAVLRLIRESGVLPSLVNPNCTHENVAEVAEIPATCVNTGYTAGERCTDCGKWISGHEAIEKNSNAHVGPIEDVEASEATCTADGYTAGTKCSACGEFISGHETVNALDHDYAVYEKVEATCLTGGYTVYKCTRCDNSYKADEVSATGHTYGEWTVVTPATCTEVGTEQRVCGACDAAETRSIPAKGHTDENGDKVCDDCGTSLGSEEQPSFFQRIINFFNRIINWFRNLFK